MNAEISEEAKDRADEVGAAYAELASKNYELQLEVVRLEAELARQPERRGFVDGTGMLQVFERLYNRAKEEHRDATARGQKERAHQLESELDALARAMNWAMRVP
jgi:hypothetical protein